MSSGLKVLDSAIAEASTPPKAKTPTPQLSQPETKEEKGGKGGKGGKDAKKDKAKVSPMLGFVWWLFNFDHCKQKLSPSSNSFPHRGRDPQQRVARHPQ